MTLTQSGIWHIISSDSAVCDGPLALASGGCPHGVLNSLAAASSAVSLAHCGKRLLRHLHCLIQSSIIPIERGNRQIRLVCHCGPHRIGKIDRAIAKAWQNV